MMRPSKRELEAVSPDRRAVDADLVLAGDGEHDRVGGADVEHDPRARVARSEPPDVAVGEVAGEAGFEADRAAGLDREQRLARVAEAEVHPDQVVAEVGDGAQAAAA